MRTELFFITHGYKLINDIVKENKETLLAIKLPIHEFANVSKKDENIVNNSFIIFPICRSSH